MTLTDGSTTTTAPLHPGQRALWFLHEIEPGEVAYNTCTAITLRGPLRLAALRRAIRQVGRRHDSLRTVFLEEDGEPRQVAAGEAVGPHLVDLTGLAEPDREVEVGRQLGRLAAIPFDLRGGPPVRWALLRCGAEHHVLLLDVHHIVFDRDSLAAIGRELEQDYTGAVRPERHASDVRLALKAWTADHHQGEAFWQRTLDGAPASSSPFAPGTARGDGPVRQRIELDHAALWSLARLCAEERATTFTAVLAVLAGLISRYTGMRDVVVGTPVSLRDDDDYADVVAMLVNTLPLRVVVGHTFRTTLRRARDTVLDALEHRRVPLHRIVELHGRADAGPADGPFQVLLAHQRPAGAPRLAGVRAEARWVDAAAAKFELSVVVTELADRLEIALEADGRRVEPERLAAFAKHLVALIQAVGEEPDARLDDVELRDAAERSAAADMARGPRVPRPATASLHGLVAAQARRAADAVAVIADGPDGPAQLTYGALLGSAARVAAALENQLDRPVGILQRRGVGLPVSYLGVLMAGGSLLPLDVEDPDRRLAELLADSGADTVLADPDQVTRAAAFGPKVLSIADFFEVRGKARKSDTVHPEQGAYVLYTSGSTGRPKGVVVPHRAIVNRLAALPLSPGERQLVKAPSTFDVSVTELFGPLVEGGCAVLAVPGGERDPQYLLDVMHRQRVGVAHFVPSMLAPFLAHVQQRPKALQRIVCSGESLPAEVSRRATATLGVPVYNLYGPTETAVEVTAWPAEPDERGRMAIGTPIDNVECWVVDERGHPVPLGAVGEVAIGGVCLARGYLNRPALTAASFVPDPASRTGARLYRSGDLGRWALDGLLEIVGRRGAQVKVGGRRVEPAEVSAALRRQPGVHDAATVVRGDRLVGFVILEDDQKPESLIDALQRELPAYMVPVQVEALPVLPLTRAGKVDTQELTRRAAALTPPTGSALPGTDLERRVADIWCEVLGLTRVGVDDGFFDVGGTSLTLLQVHRRLAGTVAPELTVQDLFRFPTVAMLARFLSGSGAIGSGAIGSGAIGNGAVGGGAIGNGAVGDGSAGAERGRRRREALRARRSGLRSGQGERDHA